MLSEPTEGRALSLLGSGLWVVVEVGCMVGAIATATGVVGTIAQIGFFASGKTLKPQFKKLNPVAGVKRLLSPHGAWELAKSLVKLAIIGSVAYSGVQKDARPGRHRHQHIAGRGDIAGRWNRAARLSYRRHFGTVVLARRLRRAKAQDHARTSG